MNCFNHNEQVAVGACQNCGVGLCAECVTDAAKIDNRPICKPCDLVRVDSAIAELSAELANINIKKIIWTVIFILGLGCLIYSSLTPTVDDYWLWFLCPIIWAFAGFGEQVTREEEFRLNNPTAATLQDLKKDQMYKDNSIFGYWIGWLFGFFIKGLFFPFIYAYFMIFGSMQIKKALKSWQEYKSNL